jgi:acyl carrier protein
VNTYGPTECTDVVAFYRIDKNNCTEKVPIGKPINNTNLYIINEHGFERGFKGELYIGGIAVGEGYRGMPELTNEKFIRYFGLKEELLYKTGDVVEKLKDDNLFFTGRIDEQIKINGHRVEPEEIEIHLNEFKKINQSIVIALDINEPDKLLKVFYTSNENVYIKDIIEYLSIKLPKYMIPTMFARVESFFLTPNGKIDRNRVHECIEIKSNDDIIESSNLNEQLSAIQKKVFDVIISTLIEKISSNVPIDAAFDSIGLDSLTFIQIVVNLESEFDFEFDDEKLLITEFPTVKSMIEYVESKVQS